MDSRITDFFASHFGVAPDQIVFEYFSGLVGVDGFPSRFSAFICECYFPTMPGLPCQAFSLDGSLLESFTHIHQPVFGRFVLSSYSSDQGGFFSGYGVRVLS